MSRATPPGPNVTPAQSKHSCTQSTMRISVKAGLTAATLLLLGGCDDLSLEPSGGFPSQLAIETDSLLLTEGDSYQMSYRLIANDGGTIPVAAWAQPTWSVESPNVVESDGSTLRAVEAGETYVTARLAETSGRVLVRVNPREIQVRVRGFYLTQSVQRADGSVPLVAGRDALLRVFVTGDRLNYFRPSVRAVLYHDGSAAQTLTLAPTNTSLPQAVTEGDLSSTWNALVPGELIRPGLSVRIEVDPDGVVPLASGSVTRHPLSGTHALDVRAVPPLLLRMVPVRLTLQGTVGRVGAENLERFLAPTYAMFPIGEIHADIRATYSSDADLTVERGWGDLLGELRALQLVEGSRGYYYGVVQSPGNSAIAGVGFVGWPAAVGYDEPNRDSGAKTMAHELGHNFGLPHAPCGNPLGVDALYPYSGASIGVFGYDVESGTLKDPGTQKDLMSYCSPEWISDYNYVNAFGFREAFDWAKVGLDEANLGSEPSLLVWGGVREGRIVLEPAFELDMKPSLPTEAGPYRVSGYDEAGTELFTYAFSPESVDHSDGSHFTFAIPGRLARTQMLTRLEVTGPEGRAQRVRSVAPQARGSLQARARGLETALSWSGDDYPMALVRDAETGEVLSFARGGAAAVHSSGRTLEVLMSDGVRNVRALIPR